MISTKEEPKLAVIYARTSSDANDDDKDIGSKHSIREQISACRELAKKNNYKVIGEFEDSRYSGRTYPTGSPYADLDQSFLQYYHQHIGQPGRKTRPGLSHGA